MGRIRLLTVGRMREPGLRTLMEEYGRRIRAWAPWEWQELPAAGADPARAAARLLQAAGPERLILLDVEGERPDSHGFARRLEAWMAAGPVTLAVAGASGWDTRARARADWRWSLSPLTFPHQLVAVLVAEQVYRALTILHHHPYHGGH
ncbi:Ribosomal RNA large subunit methyltransferase H [Candidatus Hydrogenisulfobacillus filiaventi]|uniref:Ribosomal RNA large subunit methyltransferase H n=1 Tax=Candidatus Hydrogenisulfobacillus filiaventi TaxID=2707344 RepID=A0A6F8ZKW4_9FIRM|nr:23S rRNA (pseudouridine(1915)-N(3))-methyltransferase RlmH [Bacillota bacterium]CAB1130252.1 Ribosomal RNA large subunit methyltransferase H [Candidatus Hydrogenisulfobacillus filiaventi]